MRIIFRAHRSSTFRNKFVEKELMAIFEQIWMGNTSNAYVIPKSFTSLLKMDHLLPNGQPKFHVLKESLGKT